MKIRAINADQYQVCFETEKFASLKDFLKKNTFSNYILLTDSNVKKHCLPTLLKQVKELKGTETIVVKAGEQHKHLQSCAHIWEQLTKFQADRNTLLINLGGGVVSDMGGFCASVFKRGIPFINIPTTTLSMADASVGGKTGVDFQDYKNHIGTFCNPLGVFIYPGFTKTQSTREFINGLAEVVKSGFIADKDLVKDVCKDKVNLEDILYKSVTIKNTIVLNDPREKGLRKILNFGHTIGHAIESHYLHKKHPLMHGEAIAIGMICESWIAVQKGLMKQKDLEFVEESILSLFPKVKLNSKEFKAIQALTLQDKKNKKGKLKLALIEKPGKHILDVECKAEQVMEALSYYNSKTV